MAMQRLFRLWRLGGQDLRLLLAILRRQDRPRWLAPALLLLVFFALEPLNFALPVLGVIDDFVLLPLLLRALAISASHAMAAKRDDRVVSVQ
ncbi:MAG TPA: hypothetical protein VGI90_06400 [Steroidobacteraceae bacterium]|jgi:uncharacterized membrane protein YkvA (DUF1232 family)